MTIWLRSCRCGSAPPTSIPYFSTTRNPGVVLRVPASVPCQPCARRALASAWLLVAMPEHRASRFRATRSPRRILRIGPRTVAQWVGWEEEGGSGWDSGMCHVILFFFFFLVSLEYWDWGWCVKKDRIGLETHEHPNCANTSSTNGIPATIPYPRECY